MTELAASLTFICSRPIHQNFNLFVQSLPDSWLVVSLALTQVVSSLTRLAP